MYSILLSMPAQPKQFERSFEFFLDNVRRTIIVMRIRFSSKKKQPSLKTWILGSQSKEPETDQLEIQKGTRKKNRSKASPLLPLGDRECSVQNLTIVQALKQAMEWVIGSAKKGEDDDGPDYYF